MTRLSFRRAMTACVLAAALFVAGAAPAAAAEGPASWDRVWSWLATFWGDALDRVVSVTAADTCPNGDCGLEIDPNGGSTTNGECGPEIDPNGCPKPRGTVAGSGS